MNTSNSSTEGHPSPPLEAAGRTAPSVYAGLSDLELSQTYLYLSEQLKTDLTDYVVLQLSFCLGNIAAELHSRPASIEIMEQLQVADTGLAASLTDLVSELERDAKVPSEPEGQLVGPPSSAAGPLLGPTPTPAPAAPAQTPSPAPVELPSGESIQHVSAVLHQSRSDHSLAVPFDLPAVVPPWPDYPDDDPRPALSPSSVVQPSVYLAEGLQVVGGGPEHASAANQRPSAPGRGAAVPVRPPDVALRVGGRPPERYIGPEPPSRPGSSRTVTACDSSPDD